MARAELPQVDYRASSTAIGATTPSGCWTTSPDSGCRCSSSPHGWAHRWGIVRVAETDDLADAVAQALGHDERVIVEAAARGIEVECSVLGHTGAPEASVPGEIVVRTREWYDYEAKYTPGGMELVVPARISRCRSGARARAGRAGLHAVRLRGPGAGRFLRRRRGGRCSTSSTRSRASPRRACSGSSSRRPASPMPSSSTAWPGSGPSVTRPSGPTGTGGTMADEPRFRRRGPAQGPAGQAARGPARPAPPASRGRRAAGRVEEGGGRGPARAPAGGDGAGAGGQVHGARHRRGNGAERAGDAPPAPGARPAVGRRPGRQGVHRGRSRGRTARPRLCRGRFPRGGDARGQPRDRRGDVAGRRRDPQPRGRAHPATGGHRARRRAALRRARPRDRAAARSGARVRAQPAPGRADPGRRDQPRRAPDRRAAAGCPRDGRLLCGPVGLHAPGRGRAGARRSAPSPAVWPPWPPRWPAAPCAS